MTDSAETSSFQAAAEPDTAPAASTNSTQTAAYGPGESTGSDRPELVVGAAFAGGFLVALILKRIAR